MKNSKKILSVFLSLVMVFSVFSVVPFSVSAAESGEIYSQAGATLDEANPEIQLDQTVKIHIVNPGEVVYLKFISDRDMRITLYSTSDMDTFVTLYDEDFYYWYEDDDSGENLNFKLGVNVKAGTAYYFGVRLLGNDTGSFSVTLTENTSVWEYEYDYRNDGVSITGYYGDATELEIPSSLDGYPVTSIGWYAFDDCRKLETITIPDSVESIGCYAFHDTAWYDNQPDGLIYIGNFVYSYKGECPSTIIIKDGTKGIAGGAFEYREELKNVTIPGSVTSIGEWAFSECRNLTSITIPASVTSIGNYAFNCCVGLTSVDIPDSVIFIDEGAFCGCKNLTSVTIPDSVTDIGNWAFCGCKKLKTVIIPASVTSIGWGAFGYIYNEYYEEVPMDGFTIYGYRFTEAARYAKDHGFTFIALDDDDFTEIHLDETVTVNIEDEYDTVYLIFVPDRDMRIKFYSTSDMDTYVDLYDENFDYCAGDYYSGEGLNFKLIYDVKADTVYYFGIGCWDTGSFSVTLTEYTSDWDYEYDHEYGGVSITKYFGKDTEIEIPSTLDGYSVTSIGNSVFFDDTDLTSVTIPDSVISIGSGAFSDCPELESITVPDSVEAIGGNAFRNTAWYDNQPEGLVYAGKVAYAYKGESPTEIILKDGTKGIAGIAFGFCENLTSITIPDSVTIIGAWAFNGCPNLKSITIPDSVTSIKNGTFAGCIGLESVTIPNSVTSIGNQAFASCTSLTDITLPDSVTSIDYFAFARCTGLTSITIPDSCTSIGNSAFFNCPNLKSVTIPASVTSIGWEAFGYIYGEYDRDVPIDGFTIYGYKGTDAERYANRHDFTFIPLDGEEEPIIGDVNGDGSVTVVDATIIQRYIARITDFTPEQKAAADTNGDGNVTIVDTTLIQRYIARIIDSF